MNWGLIGSKAAGWASGFNWYKWGIIAVLLLALAGGMYTLGKHNAEIKCEQAKTELAEKKTKAIVDFTNVQSSYSLLREKESQRIREVVYESGAKLNEAIAERADNISCDLSDAEFLRLNELAKATRP